MIFFVLTILACFIAGDLVRAAGASAEWTRKLVHIGACTSIALYPYFGMNRYQLAVIAAGFAIFLYLVRGTWVTRSIAYVERHSFGEVMMPVSVVITCLLDVNYLVFMCAYLVLGFSDSLASLVGQHFGRREITFFRSSKTYVGSVAFFSSCMIIILLVPWFSGVLSWRAFGFFVLLSVMLTLMEAVSQKGTDNLFLPVAGVLGMNLVLQGAI
ncbi:MAG: hypothetical protein KBT87_13250 [Gammaproteobacteria bacterium]|jgi:dolichol kinase|nr:hypothetical protein [Gammaproteobacteria bacterium]MBQ0775637.1 hypothetical protein [Gammaproteobacteria bacterium]|tara:strand:+ start:63999 stop:64637 length:639 start_codon:yes stop_codon:yes gene_type:complete